MEKIKIGIVGTGARGVFGFGSVFISDYYKDKIKIVGLCDRNEMRLKLAKEKLGKDIKIFTDYEEFLKVPGLEAVVITTPDYTHAELTIKALKKGNMSYVRNQWQQK